MVGGMTPIFFMVLSMSVLAVNRHDHHGLWMAMVDWSKSVGGMQI